MFWTEARRFGFGSLLVLGIVSAFVWRVRHHPRGAFVVAVAGAMLAVTALVAPTVAMQVRAAWMRFGRIVGAVNGTVLLVVIFFVVLTPIGLLRRLRSRRVATTWRPHQPSPRTHFEKPY